MRSIKPFTIIIAVITVLVCSYLVSARIEGRPSCQQDSSTEIMATGQRRVPVMTTPVTMRDFEERLLVQGNLEAKNIAMVPARLASTIEVIYVDEGDYVTEGRTRLFKLDSLRLRKSLEMSRQALKIAECGLNEKIANLERVDADYQKAAIDYERFEKLLKDGIVSIDEFERSESRCKQARAMHKHARTLVDLAGEQLRQADAAVDIAKKDLRDSLVYAPISGRVSKRFQEPGEMGDTGKPVIRIEDPAVIEVSALLPAQYYPRIRLGETKMRIRVSGFDIKEQIISYKSPTIHPKLRTFEIKCVLKNPPEYVVPGSMSEIEVVLQRHKALGVPLAAIQERAGRTVMFTIDKDVASMAEVKTGIETDGWIELIGQGVRENTSIVTMGQFLLEDGSKISIQKG